MARTARCCSPWFRNLAILLAALVATGESLVLVHLTTHPHIPTRVNGRLVFVGAAHVPNAAPPSTQTHASLEYQTVGVAPHSAAGLTASHRHPLQFWSTIDEPHAPSTTVERHAIDEPCAWSHPAASRGVALYHLAPKQSPPA